MRDDDALSWMRTFPVEEGKTCKAAKGDAFYVNLKCTKHVA